MDDLLTPVDLTWIFDRTRQVGDWLKGAQSTARTVSVKENATPLADVDLEADRRIRRALEERFPQIPVISEEGPIPDYEIRKRWKHLWLVDPLDGTKDYLAGRGEFTVNIALIEAGQPILGVVYAPAVGELFYGSDAGAFVERAGRGERIHSKGLVSAGAAVRVIESRSRPSHELENFLKQFRVSSRIALGSSLKICRLAEGLADLYPRFGATMEWDTAAADAVFRFSGKGGTNYSPLTYNRKSLVNPSFILGVEESFLQP